MGFARGAQLEAYLAANDHSIPATPSLIEPDNTRSNSPYSPVQHYPATRCDCLTVKQVHRELVLDFADPGGIGGTTAGSSLPRSPGPWRP